MADPSSIRGPWLLDPDVVFLNHGSFGATPVDVLAKQDEYRARMEREPVRFLVRELEPLLDAARADLARFVGADSDDLLHREDERGLAGDVIEQEQARLRSRAGDDALDDGVGRGDRKREVDDHDGCSAPRGDEL